MEIGVAFDDVLSVEEEAASLGHSGIFGSTSMLANDMLPTNALNWISGNVSFTFLNPSDNTFRQVLLTFDPKR